MSQIFKESRLCEPLSDETLKDLYYHTAQPDKESFHTWDSEYELNYLKYFHSDPEPWEKHAHALIEPRKKHIIISSLLFRPSPVNKDVGIVRNLISVMQELSWLGFPLYCLTQEGKPQRIDPNRIKCKNRNDIQYLEDLFKKSDLLPTKEIREKISHLSKKSPKDFPRELLSDESSFILDYFQLQEILHKRNKDNAEVPYQREILIPTIGTPADFPKRVGFNHHCQLEFHLEDCKETAEAVERIKTILSKTTAVKKIKVNDYRSNLDLSIILEQLPADIEELEVTSFSKKDTLNVARFTRLKKLTVGGCNIAGIEGLPASLQALKIRGYYEGTTPSPDWSGCPHLKAIVLDGLRGLEKIPDTPACLEELTVCNMEVLPRLTNPRGLKKFKLKFTETLRGELRAWLEPCLELTHLDLNPFSSEFFPKKILPPNLESLVIWKSSDQSIVFPDNLQELSIFHSPSIKEVSLPSKLRKAYLACDSALIKIDMTNAQNLQDLTIQETGVTFSKASLPGLDSLRQLENLFLLLKEQTPASDPLSLANLPLKVLFLENYPCHEISRLDKDLQVLSLIKIKNISHLNLQDHAELRHIRITGFNESLQAKWPPNLISFSSGGQTPKNSPPTPPSIYSYSFYDDFFSGFLTEPYGPDKPPEPIEFKPSPVNPIFNSLNLHSSPEFLEFKSSAMDGISGGRSRDDAQQQSNLGLPNDTFTDSKATTLEVPYRIYRKIQGKSQPEPVPFNIHRREVFDRCTWQKQTLELEKSQTPGEYKPPLDVKSHDAYTQQDIDKLPINEYFVQRPLKVSRAGQHRIPLDILNPYDKITHIHLPQNSRLLFNPVLHSYELEWTTQGPAKATLEYQFSAAPHPDFPPHHPDSLPPPALDKDLIGRLTQLFSGQNPSNASSPFTNLKAHIMKIHSSKNIQEKWQFCQKELAPYCKDFGNVTLKNRQSDWKKLEEILVEAKGACQARSMVFVMLCHFLGVEARLIGNDVHAFVELRNPQGLWETLQLGGHETQIKHTDQPLQFVKPDKKEKESTDVKKKKEEAIREGKWQPYFRNKVPEKEYKALRDVLQDLVEQTNPAIAVDNAKGARDFYTAVSRPLSENYKTRVLYIESLQDLHAFWTLFQIDDAGNAQGRPGPLQTMLDKGGIVMINWARFNPTQIAAYKSLMDDPPSFLGTSIFANKIRFIHLLTPEVQGCAAFNTRVKAFKWPKDIPWPQPPETKSVSEKKEDGVRIDLYGDKHGWESSLVGTISPTEAGLSFKPKPLTKLATQDSKPLCINLVDVPEKPEFDAFMTRVNAHDGFFIANGEEVPVPSTWRFQYQKPPKDTKASKQVREISAEAWLEADIPSPPRSGGRGLGRGGYDRYFLNSATLSALGEQQQLQTAEESNTFKMVGKPGWLQSDDKKKVKQLIQTHPLTAGEKRRVLDLIGAQQRNIEWVDLTKPCDYKSTVLPSMKALDEAVFTDKKALHKNYLLATPDPDFVAAALTQDKKNVVTIPIQTITRSSELIESMELIRDESDERKDQKTSTKKPPRFTYQTKPLLEALRAGKTVVLHGHLSDELYRSLHTLFAPDPHLKLITGTEPERMPGQLIILTEHLSQETHLARHTQSQGSLPQEALWPAYEERLKKEKIYDKDAVEKLKLLYTIAVQCLPQEAPHLSYAILKQCVMALKKSSGNDNPIKAWFQHEEPESVAYAQLNVLAKLVVGPAGNSTVRTDKLPGSHDIWKRLNCLNSAALRTVIFGKKNPTREDYQTFSTLTAETLTQKLNAWLEKPKEYKARVSQSDPYQKTRDHMRAHLNACGAVVLKGPPGSGKTWAAYQYCEEVGSPIFLANDPDAIAKWQKHIPAPGKKAVLIVDEANLKRRGTWEHLSSLISPDHHIVFTRNPNSYGGRVDHPILQKTPTVLVKKWTSQGLLDHILMPLYQKILGRKSNEEEVRTLKSLIEVYEYVQTLLPPHQLSIRDLQQLTLRWLKHPEREREPQRAAYEACLQEWQLRFGATTIEAAFVDRVQSKFPVNPKNQQTPLYEEALENWPKDFYLINPQKKLLAAMARDLQLSEDCYTLQGSDGSPLAKSGLLLEGPSGFGKSSLIRQFLLSTNHRPLEADELRDSKERDLSNCFIQFTISGDIKKDRELLRAAFKKGCKVILDELNLDPLIETELNHLLTGKTEGGEKGHPGFFLFATQNDGQMEGRKGVSPALLNRLHIMQAPECLPQHLLEAVQSALPYLSTEEQTDVVSDYLAEARADPANVNLRTFYQGLKEIKKDFPALGEKVVVIPKTVRPWRRPVSERIVPSLPVRSEEASPPSGVKKLVHEITVNRLEERGKVLTPPKSVPLPTPPLPDPLPPLRGGEGTSDSSLSPPQQVGDGILAGKFGIFSSPEARKKLVDATWIYLPFLLSLATFSMAGISIAAANQMKLEGMLKSYPDYASQYFQPDIKRGEMIAFAMIVAAMAFLITSVYNRRKATPSRSSSNSRFVVT